MEPIELAQADRDRIDTLIGLLQPGPEVLVTCTEAARLLGVKANTVTRMLKEGRLHRTTIDGSTGIRLSEIDLTAVRR